MITENLSTLKIHKLSEEQFNREDAAGRLDATALYLTPDTTQEQLDKKVDKVDGMGLSTNDFTNDLLTKLSGIAEGAEVNVQSDWNQNDETSADYVKNRTHSVRYEKTVLFQETEIVPKIDGSYAFPVSFVLIPGDTYIICVNGVETSYIAREIQLPEGNLVFAGDLPHMRGLVYDISSNRVAISGVLPASTNAMLAVYHVKEVVNGLAPKYFPDGGIGYVSNDYSVLTFDGDLTGKTYFEFDATKGIQMVKVLDRAIEPSEVELLVLTLAGQSSVLPLENCQIRHDLFFWELRYNNASYVVSVTTATESVSTGTYLAAYINSDGNVEDYVNAVHGPLQENIHSIDPKFLPKGGFGYGENAQVWSGTVSIDGVECDAIDLIEGVMYAISYNDTVYNCVCKAFTADDGQSYQFIGNRSFVDLNDTGEPFFAATIPLYNMSVVAAAEDAYITITRNDIHKIDPKFLPEEYVTQEEIDAMELITIDDIDQICGKLIRDATISEVTF